MTELEERFAGRRNADAPADTQEHRLLELVFEEENLPADRRLRDVELVAGGGERPRFGDGSYDFQLSKIHDPLPKRIRGYISWRDGFKGNDESVCSRQSAVKSPVVSPQSSVRDECVR